MRALLSLSVLLATAALPAQVSLPAIFADHMVLQCDKPVVIWGLASPGEAISVALTNTQSSGPGSLGPPLQVVETTAGDDGRWSVKLDARKAGHAAHMLAVNGKNAVTLRDVKFGEVWICSGQSNMEWPVKRANDADREIAAADHPEIRLFTVKRTVAGEPRDDVVGTWSVCSPETVGDFSAVGYFFGRELANALEVPIGLVHSSWGGTPAESWTSREALEKIEVCAPILERWDDVVANADQRRAEYDRALAVWTRSAEEAKASGKEPPKRPNAPPDPNHPHRASALYNAMIAPLTQLAIRGAIWYQGESNAGRAFQYRTLFPAMIRDWRQRFGQGDFPFLFVQLANFKTGNPAAWAELREAQTLALALPNTAMAVAIDIGDPKDIHPRNKQEVGRRLALGALAEAYGRELVHSGPLYTGMTIDGGRVRVSFAHVGGGLKTADGKPLRGFQIAARDGQFVDASAEIDGTTVVVHSDAVAEPFAVRYAWSDDPDCNLANAEGLPASPFRTDDLPGVTDKAR